MWLFRHGETEWNRIGRKQGRDDSPLSATGREQAGVLAAFAKRQGIQRLLVSPLGRAQATAARIAAECGATIETHDALAEMSFGECSGLTVPEIEAAWPGLHEAREHDRWEHRWPGGESYADIVTRLAAWSPALPDLPAPHTAVVAHQGLNCALTALFGPCPPEMALALRQVSSTVLWLGGGGVVVAHELVPGTVDAVPER
jgi:probable phosphoglycerate mutase